MDLWIRSQDKENLIKVDNLGLAYIEKYNFIDRIGDIAKKEHYICQFQKNSHTTLGKFASKERALEVLDEISDELISANYMPLEENEKITCGSARVYEMPKE